MDQNKSKQHWDNIYTVKGTQDVSWFQSDPRTSIELIQNIGNNKALVIDIGAGASTLVDSLLKLGYSNLAVLDISDKVINLVKERLGERAANVECYKDDITQFLPLHTYDIWHDRAVFHFLLDEESKKSYITVLKKAVKTGGHVIIATFAKDGPKKCSGLDTAQYDSASITLALGEEFKLLKTVPETHLTPGGDKQLFMYFVFERK